MENFEPKIEQEKTPDWREFLQNPDDVNKLSGETVAKLDDLFKLMTDENDQESKEIREEYMEMFTGDFRYSNPINIFVGFFRGYLGQEERSKINKDLRDLPQKRRSDFINFISADPKDFE